MLCSPAGTALRGRRVWPPRPAPGPFPEKGLDQKGQRGNPPLHSPRCHSVKKMCRWHIFSVGRSGYAARKEPCLSFPLPANISLLRRGAHCAPRLGMALRFLLLEGPPRAAVPTVFQVQSTEVFLFYPQKVMKKGPGRQSGAKCKLSLPSRSAQPTERAFMKAFFAYFLSRKKVG